MKNISSNRLKVVPCICPNCNGELDGLNNDKIFICSQCCQGIDLYQSPPEIFSVFFARPAYEFEAPVIYLPFWEMTFAATFNSKDVGKAEKASGLVPSKGLIAGFKTHGFATYGNLSQIFTRQSTVFQEASNTAPMAGCCQDRSLAEKLLEIVVLGIIDRGEDVTDLEMKLEILQTRIIGFPFYDLGSKLKDSILGEEILMIAIDDLPSLRLFIRK